MVQDKRIATIDHL